MGWTRVFAAAACIWVLGGCERPQGISLAPRMMRAPSDEQMERVAVYAAFLARQVPKTTGGGGRRMEGLLIREPISYRGYELSIVQKYVFPNNRLSLQGGLGYVGRSYELGQDTLTNFYVEGARTDDLFSRDEFTGPFVALSDEDLNSQFHMEPCHPTEMCGLRLIQHYLPNSGGLWCFSHIGFSRNYRQALVYYNNVFRGETGVALLEKGAGGWSVVATAVMSVS